MPQPLKLALLLWLPLAAAAGLQKYAIERKLGPRKLTGPPRPRTRRLGPCSATRRAVTALQLDAEPVRPADVRPARAQRT